MNYRKYLLPLLLVLFLMISFASNSFAQVKDSSSVRVTIKIISQREEPVGLASITITHPFNGTTLTNIIADSAGRASVILAKDSQYLIRVSSVNYQPAEKGIRITGSQPTFTNAMEPLPKTLGGVVVRSQKPLIR